jgi:hypothetical protein
MTGNGLLRLGEISTKMKWKWAAGEKRGQQKETFKIKIKMLLTALATFSNLRRSEP